MVHFLKQKLINKKWLNVCLLMGIILLIAVMACQPMFRQGSMNCLLVNDFQNYVNTENQYPIIFTRESAINAKKNNSLNKIKKNTDQYKNTWLETLNLPERYEQLLVRSKEETAVSNITGNAINAEICYMDQIKDHVQMVCEDSQKETNKSAKGVYDCIISEKTMDTLGFVAGEELQFVNTGLKDAETGKEIPLTLRVKGIFKEADETDPYWCEIPSSFDKQLFVEEATLNSILEAGILKSVHYTLHVMPDYRNINYSNGLKIKSVLEQFYKLDKKFSDNIYNRLCDFESGSRTIEMLLMVLSLPVICMLLAFLYMISSQILSMEAGEIAMLRSRGVARWQILLLYFAQTMILCLLGLLPGILLGGVFGKMAASTDSFMHFTRKNTSMYALNMEMLPYAFVAILVATVFVVMPVFGYAAKSIVEQKRDQDMQNAKKNKILLIPGVLLTLLSLYFLYNYKKQIGSIALDMIAGKTLDPIVFLDSCIFILGAGILAVWLIRFIVGLIYKIGLKHWKPAGYASLLQITRSPGKQGFLSLFLIMTVAVGVFQSGLARTVNENETQRIQYNLGTDAAYEEEWKPIIFRQMDAILWHYNEPDYERYSVLKDYCEQWTKVIVDKKIDIKIAGTTLKNCQLMGISTKEFGETARMQQGITDEDWFIALNELSKEADGVIISQNLAEDYNLKVGDVITYARYGTFPDIEKEEIGSVIGKVKAIVKGFPGYESYSYERDEKANVKENDNYLIVANYAYLVSRFTMTPYQVWMRFKDGVKAEQVKELLENQNIQTKNYESMQSNLEAMQSEPMILITNGMFTLSFLITIILSATGFLIYWINSIRQRELLFGIYRAMGMSMKELNQMLLSEQCCSSLAAILAGGALGAGSIALFMKLVTIVYLPYSHNIPIRIFVNMQDMIRLAVMLVIMVVLCLYILRRILKGMNITQALKIGED